MQALPYGTKTPLDRAPGCSRFSFRRLSLNTFWVLIYGSLLAYVFYLRFFSESSEDKVREAVVDVIRLVSAPQSER